MNSWQSNLSIAVARHCIKCEIGVDIVGDTIQTGPSIGQRQFRFVDTNTILIASPIFAVILSWLSATLVTVFPDIDGHPDIMMWRTASEQIFHCGDRFDVKARVVYASGRREEELTEGGFWLWNLLRQLWELVGLVNKPCATRGR